MFLLLVLFKVRLLPTTTTTNVLIFVLLALALAQRRALIRDLVNQSFVRKRARAHAAADRVLVAIVANAFVFCHFCALTIHSACSTVESGLRGT